MDIHHFLAWAIFLAMVLVMLGLDLFVFHRKPHAIKFGEALFGALVPVGMACLFSIAIYFAYQSHFLDLGLLPVGVRGTSAEKYYPTTGGEASLLYFTGYLVELSLSADNVFLFVVLMNFFKTPPALQHRVLFWGVLGALVMRAIMILAGAALLSRFQWIIYLFGLFLLYAGAKMMFSGHESGDPSKSMAVRYARKIFNVHDGYEGKNFFTRVDGRKVATTLFLVLVCIEFTDLVFALDSIPAIFGITRDPFIVFTSNVFAILGLRSMYFLLAGVMDKFHLLKYGLAAVLVFVGVKMFLPGLGDLYGHFAGRTVHWDVDELTSLSVIVGSLTLSIVASLLTRAKERTHNPLEEEPPRRSRSPIEGIITGFPQHAGNTIISSMKPEIVRPRRLRSHPKLREMLASTHLSPGDLIAPIFVRSGKGVRTLVKSMPGVFQFSVDTALEELRRLDTLGVGGFILFGVTDPDKKDPTGSYAHHAENEVCRTLKAAKDAGISMLAITDLCYCEYTSHGHCGPLTPAGTVDNDATIAQLGQQAAVHAKAGADIVAPSGMMDNMVAAIRAGLDQNGFGHTGILSYAVKYASSFYGPFRDAAESPPQFDDRKTYQMDFRRSASEALREARIDVQQGADWVMVKPGIAYLDILRAVSDAVEVPTCVYQVSGEYAMLKAAAANGWIDEKGVVKETMHAFKRAGASAVLSYYAGELAQWLGD